MPLLRGANLIKECNVVLHNNRVAVILLDGRKIQIPHSELVGDKAYIKFENGKYVVVSKEDFDKQNSKKTKKQSNENKELETEKVDVNSELY